MIERCCSIRLSGEKEDSEVPEEETRQHIIDLHIPPPPPLPPPLLLTIQHKDEKYEKQCFYNLLDNRCLATQVPILTNIYVLGSAYGWLVLVDISEDGEGCCLLWNPTSSEIIRLLYFEEPNIYSRCIFSCSPTDPDCFIMIDQFNCSSKTVCMIQDTESVFQVDFEELGCHVTAMVSFKGSIFGISEKMLPGFVWSEFVFVTLHVVNGDTLEVRPLLQVDGGDGPIQSWVKWKTNYLMESPCGNELLLVTRMSYNDQFENSSMQFRVFRLDLINSRMVCQELFNLDGRTVFIGLTGNGFCCRYLESYGTSIKPNSIYYTSHFGMEIHVYDMDDRGTTTLLPPRSDLDFNLAWVTNYWVNLPHNILDSLVF